MRNSLAKTATTTTKARRVFITVTRQRAGSIGARPDQYCCAMGGTHLDADTAGSLHLVDLVRSLVRSEDIFSVEHEADWFPADVGAPEWWADNGCWADSLMQPPKRVCLEERSPKREADDAGRPGPSPVAVPVALNLKHQVGRLHNPMFDFSWSAGVSNHGNAAPLVQRRGCSVANVQAPEHVDSDGAVLSNTAEQPSLVPLEPGAGRQKTPTLSRRCSSSAPQQRFTRSRAAAVRRTLLVSPNASPSRCTSPLQFRSLDPCSPSRSPLQNRNV